jgi:hypothetical protein
LDHNRVDGGDNGKRRDDPTGNRGAGPQQDDGEYHADNHAEAGQRQP